MRAAGGGKNGGGATLLSIGIDDTDSAEGMCTTYLGFMLAAELLEKGEAGFASYPRLVRLNPNVPWRTRGNGAVGLRVLTDDPGAVKERAIGLVRRCSDVKNGANPAVAFCEGEVPAELAAFGRAALWRLLPRARALEAAERHGLETFRMGNGRGLVGAVSAIGYEFGDSTLEILAYRERGRFGTARAVSPESVRLMHERTRPRTFNSYDEEKRRALVSPRGPDPVLYGIRGEDPAVLLAASRSVDAGEPLAGYMMFQSNQGTGDHLAHELGERDAVPHASGTVTGTVSGPPRVGPGGHAYFEVAAAGAPAGSRPPVRCAAYKESGLAGCAAAMRGGDAVRAGGGIRRAAAGHPRVLNAEFLEILDLARPTREANPACGRCAKRMKSKGAGQGFKCIKCGSRAGSKVAEAVPRRLRRGLYLPPASAQRHLARPLQRQGVTNAVGFDGSVAWIGRFEVDSGE